LAFRRATIYLSVLYWAVAAKIAVLRAMYGIWDPGGPMAFLGACAVVYLVCFGFLWTLGGFFYGPRC
jgi:hypothetical protein